MNGATLAVVHNETEHMYPYGHGVYSWVATRHGGRLEA